MHLPPKPHHGRACQTPGQARDGNDLGSPEEPSFLHALRPSGKGQAGSDRNFNGSMELWKCSVASQKP
jgi:hypothetical protein